MVFRKHGRFRFSLLFSIMGILILGMGLFPLSTGLQAEILNIPLPQLLSIQPTMPRPAGRRDVQKAQPVPPIRKVYTVDQGDTFFEILKENGVSGEDALDIIKSVKHVFNTAKIKPGNEIVLIFTPEDQSLTAIEYEISDLKRLAVTIEGDKIRARKIDSDHEERLLLPAKTEIPTALSEKPQAPVQGDTPKAESGLRRVDVKIRKGHNVFDILSDLGVSKAEISEFAGAARKVHNLKGIRQGQSMTVLLTQDKPIHIKRMTYEVDDNHYLEVASANGTFKARLRELAMDARLEQAQGRISSSLYESARAAGLNHEIIMDLTDIFAWNINFFTDVQPGDTFSVVFEKYYVKDQFKGYGRVMAARFVNQGQEHVAIYYQNPRSGDQGYYDENGKPLKKMFLKAPLNFRRISSTFTQRRLHPIFNRYRPHLGVDYAAPTGTPVCALGPGRIAFKGRDKGFGNAIRVKHPAGYVSYYAHLSRYAKGIAVGRKVDQGDVIGYVGSTGYSTGPHLDFRVSHAGKFVNPLDLKSVNGPTLHGRSLADFRRLSSQRMVMLTGPERASALSSLEKSRTATKLVRR